jgi:hypothetical protein
MLLNITIGALLIVVTTRIHAEGMLLASLLLRTRIAQEKDRLQRKHIYLVGAIVLVMFLTSIVEVLVWAFTYVGLNAIEGFEQTLYFSMVTFTTLGYGDVVLTEDWRLLASIQAANGAILLGWTTAIVIAAVQRIILVRIDKHDEQYG